MLYRKWLLKRADGSSMLSDEKVNNLLGFLYVGLAAPCQWISGHSEFGILGAGWIRINRAAEWTDQRMEGWTARRNNGRTDGTMDRLSDGWPDG